MTTQRRIGIVMLLSAIAIGAVLQSCLVHLFHVDTTTIIGDGSSTTTFDVSPNWFVVGPLVLWALAAVGLLILPSRLGFRYWEKFQRLIPQGVLRVVAVALALVITAIVVLWWNHEPHPGQYDPSLPSTSLERDIRIMWKTQLLKGDIESAGVSTPTPHASTDAAINAASRVFNTVKLAGLTREEVIAMLGDPRKSNDSIYNFPFYPVPKGSMIYRFDSGAYGWQFDLLFDVDGKVRQVERRWID